MFENIIGQKRVVDELERAFDENKLPASLLFSGEHYSGKMSTALELARVLTCTGTRSWNCSCKACENQRLLLHPYVQLLGNSFFMDEITACADILKAGQQGYARYMFIRAVRKLLKRFDPVLWEGNEPKYKQAAGSAVNAEEMLREINIEGELPEQTKLSKKIDRIVNECGKIAGTYSSDNIPIDQIRRINSWAHTSSDSVKIVILENADLMQESSRNSMLKILEEPPAGCFFILTTARKGAIIPTILSRVRVFNFQSRSSAEVSEVISRIFREENHNCRSVREFFLGRKADLGTLRKLTESFLQTVLERDSGKNLGNMGDFGEVASGKRLFVLFIEEIIEKIRQLMLEGKLDYRRAAELNGLFREALAQREQYNQSGILVLESLLYKSVRI